MADRYDLVLKGGEVIDPGQGLRGLRDVAFRDGKVASVAATIPAEDSRRAVDVSGKVVTPGLIDIHGHYFEHIVPWATSADRACLPNGVTTTVDAGSSGWTHFDGFKEFILRREKTRLMALINLSALGMMSSGRDGTYGPTVGISGGPRMLLPQDFVGELQDLRYAQVEEVARCIQDNPNVALGVKIRIDSQISGEANAIPALERARRVADIAGCFVMVHVARAPIALGHVLEYLRPGDVVTHIFHSAENNVLDAKGKVRTEVSEAKSRGIVMDTGAARGNFGVRVSQAAIGQGLMPDTISTDITRDSLNAGRSLPGDMSMFMGLGMSLEDVITATTVSPAKAIGQEGVLGTLQVGAVGDAAVFELESGRFAYDDAEQVEVTSDRRLTPFMTVKDGRVWESERG